MLTKENEERYEAKMITTVTLNPAVDKTYTTARLMQGQVNRMDSVRNIAGGKGINVAKVLRQYGYEVRAMGFLGGYTGSFIEERAKQLQMQCRFTHVTGETRSSINILAADGYVTELLEPGPTITEEELQQFLADYEAALADSSLLILSGSAPSQIPTDIYRTLIAQAHTQGKKVLLDASGELLRKGVSGHPFMIKPNHKELELLSGRRIKGLDAIAEAAVALHEGGVPHVMISLGELGILYVGNKKVLYVKAPKVKVQNTVGCGDCVVAAFAMAYEQKLSQEDTLRYCAAISAANAMTLENGNIPMEEADKLISQMQIQQW